VVLVFRLVDDHIQIARLKRNIVFHKGVTTLGNTLSIKRSFLCEKYRCVDLFLVR
jgi:hypothetical protein